MHPRICREQAALKSRQQACAALMSDHKHNAAVKRERTRAELDSTGTAGCDSSLAQSTIAEQHGQSWHLTLTAHSASWRLHSALDLSSRKAKVEGAPSRTAAQHAHTNAGNKAHRWQEHGCTALAGHLSKRGVMTSRFSPAPSWPGAPGSHVSGTRHPLQQGQRVISSSRLRKLSLDRTATRQLAAGSAQPSAPALAVLPHEAVSPNVDGQAC